MDCQTDSTAQYFAPQFALNFTCLHAVLVKVMSQIRQISDTERGPEREKENVRQDKEIDYGALQSKMNLKRGFLNKVFQNEITSNSLTE